MTYKKAHKIVCAIPKVYAREFEKNRYEVVCKETRKVICR